MAKVGRPSQYTPEKGALICADMASGMSLRAVCRQPGMPSLGCVLEWVSKYPEFADQYARAAQARADAKFDELDDVSDQAASATSAVKVAGLRLKADNIKWMLARMAPKKYGDKLELSGNAEAPLAVTVKYVSAPDRG